jgi:heat shock protein HslJ
MWALFKRSTFFLVGAAVMLFAACTTQPGEIPGTGADETPAAPDIPPAAVLTAQQWAAEQLNVPAEQIQILEMEQAVWLDSCLGLGGPAESCLQVETPGWRAIFEVNGIQYEVRTNETAGEVRMVPQDGTPGVAIGLEDTHWSLVSFGAPGAETPLVEGSSITLLLADGQAGGFGGCNSYGTTYQVAGNELTFGQITSTLVACEDDQVTQQEQEYFRALESANSYELEGNHLRITYDGGEGLLVFETPVTTGEDGTPAP